MIRIRIFDVESRSWHGERQAQLLFALALDVSILTAERNPRAVRIPMKLSLFEIAGSLPGQPPDREGALNKEGNIGRKG